MAKRKRKAPSKDYVLVKAHRRRKPKRTPKQKYKRGSAKNWQLL